MFAAIAKLVTPLIGGTVGKMLKGGGMNTFDRIGGLINKGTSINMVILVYCGYLLSEEKLDQLYFCLIVLGILAYRIVTKWLHAKQG
jgi:hypothetical protein